MSIPTISTISTLSVEQMIEVDRVMVEDLGVTLPMMMENAGRSLARLASEVFDPRSVSVLAGSGGNGGGALVAARHLFNRGVAVFVSTTRPIDAMQPVTAMQARILDHMGVPIVDSPPETDLVIDGLVGYSLSGSPDGRTRDLIEGSRAATILALDVPSGVAADTGSSPGVSVTAAATLTLALPFPGLISNPRVGRLFLADISVPPFVYRAFGIDLASPFDRSGIVELLPEPY